MKLTAKRTDVLRLAPGERDKIWFDDDIAGRGLRVREGGKRVWNYQYAIGGRARRLTRCLSRDERHDGPRAS